MASLQNNYSLCGRSLSWKMGSERTPCQNQKVDLGFPNPGVMLIDLDKSVNLLVTIWSEKKSKKTEHDNIMLERR